MENKKSNVVLITLLVLFILGLGGYIVYDKVLVKDNNENELNFEDNEETTKNNSKYAISTSDLFAYYKNGETLVIAKVEDDTLYILETDQSVSSLNGEFKKVLDNVKVVKIHFGSDYSPKFLAVMSDGTVKDVIMNAGVNGNDINVIDSKLFNEYKVKKVLTYEVYGGTVDCSSYEIKFVDKDDQVVELKETCE